MSEGYNESYSEITKEVLLQFTPGSKAKAIVANMLNYKNKAKKLNNEKYKRGTQDDFKRYRGLPIMLPPKGASKKRRDEWHKLYEETYGETFIPDDVKGPFA